MQKGWSFSSKLDTSEFESKKNLSAFWNSMKQNLL